MRTPPERVRFDEAKQIAFEIAHNVAAAGSACVLVRDLLGRFLLVIDDTGNTAPPGTHLDGWRTELVEKLQRYAVREPIVLASSLFAPESVLASPRAVDIQGSGEGAQVRYIDNTVVGEDWARVSSPSRMSSGVSISRVALYGFKGGVGRSTATFMLGKRLAERGHCVLVVDLDLESPGAGPLLLSEEALPEYGLVDHLVEAALDNADGLDLVAQSSTVTVSGNGELWVAPARGRGRPQGTYAYVEKLNRVYSDLTDTDRYTFADRLEQAVSACEQAVAERSRPPNVVLLDSRAGIHDIAAITISRLCDLAFLFGSDSIQTWRGYRDLFLGWQESGQATEIREKLRMVASMVPDDRSSAYLEAFRDHAWTCFSALYDDVPGGGDGGVFNPSPEDVSAPHFPLPILFTYDLVGLDSVGDPAWSSRQFVETAYREFLATATRLIVEGQ